MLGVGYSCIEYLLGLIEVLTLYIFLMRCTKKRTENKGIRILIIMIVSILIYLKGTLEFSLIQGNIYSMLIIFIYIMMISKIEIWKGSIYTIICILSFFICDFIVIEVYCVLYPGTTLNDMAEVPALRYNAALASKVCSFAILILFAEKEKATGKIPYLKENLSVLIGTISLTLLCLYTLHGIIQFEVRWENSATLNFLICLLSIGILFINIMVYWSIKRLNETAQIEKEYNLIQYQNELLIKAAEENQEIEHEWRRIKHDFNNHISCIDMLLQMKNIEKARAYIQNLTKNTGPEALQVHTGNDIADAILNQKLLCAKSHKIAMMIQGELSTQLHIADVDLCAILSNSLDNAIEAAYQIEDIHKRKIEVAIVGNDHSILIKICNTVKPDIVLKGDLQTTKKDRKRHGIGMRSMQMAVRKYNGHLSWQCKEGVFILNIMLPI